MTREAWLRAHPFLAPIGRFVAQVEGALATIAAPPPELPQWDEHAAEYAEGVPLLLGSAVAIDCGPGGTLAWELVERLAAAPAGGEAAADVGALCAQLRAEPDPARSVADSLLGTGSFAPAEPGLLRHLGWTAMHRWLRPLAAAFVRWRDEERWLRRHCPMCGALPAMAVLVGAESGRMRFLCCGQCGSRWRHRRTACPFCEADSQKVSILTVQSEPRLRIEYCEACRAYLKCAAVDEELLLADWTSLHLDVLAHDRGLIRNAMSLYDVDAIIRPA